MKRLLYVAAAAMTFALTGCANEVVVPPSPTLPAALGEATATKDANGNTKVHLEVKHMAPPQNLQPPKSVYVVWAETPEKQRYNLGQLRVDQNRKGEINTTTAFKTFRLIVTAEDYPTVTESSGQEVLSTGVLQAK